MWQTDRTWNPSELQRDHQQQTRRGLCGLDQDETSYWHANREILIFGKLDKRKVWNLNCREAEDTDLLHIRHRARNESLVLGAFKKINNKKTAPFCGLQIEHCRLKRTFCLQTWGAWIDLHVLSKDHRIPELLQSGDKSSMRSMRDIPKEKSYITLFSDIIFRKEKKS